MALRTWPYPDFYNLEKTLSEEQRSLIEAVRQFVRKEAMPLFQEAYEKEEFPTQLIPLLGRFGAFTMSSDPVSYGLLLREMERCDSGLRSLVSVQSSLVMFPIREFGSEEQKAEWLDKLGKGQAVGCFGLTESEGGSDPSHMKTTAKLVGKEWVLNGSKMWITNGNIADIAVVWAQTSDGIRGFLIPKGTKGFGVTQMKGKLSLRASITSELYLNDVRLPASALLPKAQGLKGPLSCLTQARFGIAFGVLGAAEACFDQAAKYIQERILFDKKLGSFQLVQRKMALMLRDITLGQCLAFRLADLKTKNELDPAQVSLAKQNNVDMALNVARTCRDILGANGIMGEYPVMRHMCNLETVFTYEGTNDIHLLVLGREVTGISAFS